MTVQPLVTTTMRREHSLSKKIAYSALPLILFYLLAETVATTIAWSQWWGSTLVLFEESERTLRFDPVRGYRLTSTPSRFCRITNGSIEYVGTFRGNSQGFPDRDDFSASRPAAGLRRIAVFGDSFTSAQYLAQNWPDRVEDHALADGQPVQLLNFAVDGGGLANWWSIMLKIMDAEDYQIDEVVFAVYPGDLRRRFLFLDHRDAREVRFCRLQLWSSNAHPTTIEEARQLHQVQDIAAGFVHIVSFNEFERVLQGHWPGSVPQRRRPFIMATAYRSVHSLWRSVYSAIAPSHRPATATATGPESDPDRRRLIADIRQSLERRNISATVVHLPDREEFVSPTPQAKILFAEAQSFASDLGAKFVDGRQIYSGMDPSQVRTHYFPEDGHWNQSGSNLFAEYYYNRLIKRDRRDPVPPL